MNAVDALPRILQIFKDLGVDTETAHYAVLGAARIPWETPEQSVRVLWKQVNKQLLCTCQHSSYSSTSVFSDTSG